MSKGERSLLSVIVRRFPPSLAGDVEKTLEKTQDAMANQPGFVGLQNSLSHEHDYCELVTVFAFDCADNLEQWKRSPLRDRFVKELDIYSQDSVTQVQFDDLAVLLDPKAKLRKIETVAILIFWILLLGNVLRYVADLYLPDIFSAPWRNTLLILVNVLLISYIFLPWTSRIVTRLKANVAKVFK